MANSSQRMMANMPASLYQRFLPSVSSSAMTGDTSSSSGMNVRGMGGRELFQCNPTQGFISGRAYEIFGLIDGNQRVVLAACPQKADCHGAWRWPGHRDYVPQTIGDINGVRKHAEDRVRFRINSQYLGRDALMPPTMLRISQKHTNKLYNNRGHSDCWQDKCHASALAIKRCFSNMFNDTFNAGQGQLVDVYLWHPWTSLAMWSCGPSSKCGPKYRGGEAAPQPRGAVIPMEGPRNLQYGKRFWCLPRRKTYLINNNFDTTPTSIQQHCIFKNTRSQLTLCIILYPILLKPQTGLNSPKCRLLTS